MKNFAVVDNGVVINVIIADDGFAQMYTTSPNHIGECFEYSESHEDDTIVARIGDSYINGKFITPPIVSIVPQSITRIQAMKAMKNIGIWETFKNVLASNQDAQDEWDLATELRRDNEFVQMLIPALNLSNKQFDELFNQASLL
jgi:hypothetical protein